MCGSGLSDQTSLTISVSPHTKRIYQWREQQTQGQTPEIEGRNGLLASRISPIELPFPGPPHALRPKQTRPEAIAYLLYLDESTLPYAPMDLLPTTNSDPTFSPVPTTPDRHRSETHTKRLGRSASRAQGSGFWGVQTVKERGRRVGEVEERSAAKPAFMAAPFGVLELSKKNELSGDFLPKHDVDERHLGCALCV